MSLSLLTLVAQKYLLELARAVGRATYDDAAAGVLIALLSTGYSLRGIAWNKPNPYSYRWYERPQDNMPDDKSRQKITSNIAEQLEESVWML